MALFGLPVVTSKDGQWVLYLAGSSIVRVVETVRMAVALYENNIPFKLRDAEELYRWSLAMIISDCARYGFPPLLS